MGYFSAIFIYTPVTLHRNRRIIYNFLLLFTQNITNSSPFFTLRIIYYHIQCITHKHLKKFPNNKKYIYIYYGLIYTDRLYMRVTQQKQQQNKKIYI